ncbi:MAG: GUN4 domain-containing protein [Cyanobacteria bacterium]|nr:GUN4 domain-containing protein [Cyanobacteria bacterium CG_2015-16_32_12]NCO77740.1 GUN4 domain-containing protein [Cyanobacteria bacterium CG_2015-22_32_23]NCQ03426.1 GUN4 domain-containing protein [Cyanobacteria bacterium CG_2015-09_32_10]NCQ42123.1 GUN4 domain-containing protein [Cyanobacteria bacterium CG_2015-04_32_10]NCS83582.1 GUN4 domain-containing protein [Cyanobacteria bacterium CG_2015-02_32_10]
MKIKSFVLALILTIFPHSFYQTQAQTLPSSQNTNSISADNDIDFSTLEKYLVEQNWRKANDETRNIILQGSGRKSIGWIPPSDLKNLSCDNLKTIDTLWKENSNGRFGFSIQFPIYIETGNRPGRMVSDDAFNRFGDRIGWRKDNDWIIFYENLNFTNTAPIAHFPNPRAEYSITGGRLLYSVLAEKMVQCKIVNYKK